MKKRIISLLLAAALVLPLLLAVGSAFIWDFEVTGNDTCLLYTSPSPRDTR